MARNGSGLTRASQIWPTEYCDDNGSTYTKYNNNDDLVLWCPYYYISKNKIGSRGKHRYIVLGAIARFRCVFTSKTHLKFLKSFQNLHKNPECTPKAHMKIFGVPPKSKCLFISIPLKQKSWVRHSGLGLSMDCRTQ